MSWVKTKAYMKCEGEGGTGWPFCPKVLYLKLGTIPLISFYTLEVGVFIGRDGIGTSHPVFHPEKGSRRSFCHVSYISRPEHCLIGTGRENLENIV